MTGYLGTPGGPRDPATRGGYCLTRCYCGTCPQYAEQQRQLEVAREQEYQARLAREHDRAEAHARRLRENAAALRTTPKDPAPTERVDDQHLEGALL